LNNKDAIRRINQQDILDKDFEAELLSLVFPTHKVSKPTFRQLISHNIRYEDNKVTNTLKTLNNYTSDIEYSTLHLFMLGCEFLDGEQKKSLTEQHNQETAFKKKLEKKQTKNEYEIALNLLNNDITVLDKRKKSLNLNENIEIDLDKLNIIKLEISRINAEIGRLNIRKEIIIEAKKDLEASITKIDVEQLSIIYRQATQQISGIQKTFEDLVQYHNQMFVE
jgi:hypothetical protein